MNVYYFIPHVIICFALYMVSTRPFIIIIIIIWCQPDQSIPPPPVQVSGCGPEYQGCNRSFRVGDNAIVFLFSAGRAHAGVCGWAGGGTCRCVCVCVCVCGKGSFCYGSSPGTVALWYCGNSVPHIITVLLLHPGTVQAC